MQHQVEVLQVSTLENYDWPELDPHGVAQRTREMDHGDLALVRQCLETARINMDVFVREARRSHMTDAEMILALISHRKFQMNPTEQVRAEPKWKESVTQSIQHGRPVDVVYPQFCVIPNAPKRYTNIRSAAGEDCTIEFFKMINDHVKAIYAPGVCFHALADAALYASAFQTHQTEVDAYYASVQQRIADLAAEDCIKLYDYSELLRTRCHPDYQVKYYTIGQRVWAGNPADLLPNTNLETLWRSVRCSVNTRRFQLTHDDHRKLFGPMKWRDTDHRYHALIETLTDIAYRELITIRLACGDVDISTRLWPDAIRATCHKGPKNGRWALGLRPYPEYYGSCKLLPYHGMPVVNRDSKGRPRLEIVPEVLLRGRPELVRVTWDGKDEVYMYVADDIDFEIHGPMPYDQPYGMRIGEDYPTDKRH